LTARQFSPKPVTPREICQKFQKILNNFPAADFFPEIRLILVGKIFFCQIRSDFRRNRSTFGKNDIFLEEFEKLAGIRQDQDDSWQVAGESTRCCGFFCKRQTSRDNFQGSVMTCRNALPNCTIEDDAPLGCLPRMAAAITMDQEAFASMRCMSYWCQPHDDGTFCSIGKSRPYFVRATWDRSYVCGGF
jgi:hypothetical protein